MFRIFFTPCGIYVSVIMESVICLHLDLRRLLALSSQCSDTVSSSWRRAIAFSTDAWGARPTPWSMSLLMVSKDRLAGWVLACCTPSSQRACSSLTLKRGSSGSSTSKSKLTSKRLWISATLGTSSARTFSLCCWKSSMRFKSSYRETSNHFYKHSECEYPTSVSINHF